MGHLAPLLRNILVKNQDVKCAKFSNFDPSGSVSDCLRRRHHYLETLLKCTRKASKYLDHIRMSRSSDQGQGQGHSSKKACVCVPFLGEPLKTALIIAARCKNSSCKQCVVYTFKR